MSYPGDVRHPPTGGKWLTQRGGGSSRGPLLAFIGVGAGVLVLMLVAQFVLLFIPPPVDPSLEGRPGAGTPQEAVQGYLDALAGGHADDALAFGADLPPDTTFLTDAVLAATHKKSPITGVTVQPAAEGDTSVKATYKIGGTAVSTSIPVVKLGQAWYVQNVTGSIDLTPLGSVPAKVAGVDTRGAFTIDVFPGSYTVASTDPAVSLSKATVVVKNPGDTKKAKPKVAISDKGVKKIQAAAKKKLDSCLKQKALAPRGCGFGITLAQGSSIKTSSIKWTVSTGNISAIKPTIASDGLPFSSAKTSLTLRFRANSTRANYYYDATIHIKKVSITVISQDNIVITFQQA